MVAILQEKSWFLRNFGLIVSALKKDLKAILALAIVLGVIGAVLGKMSNTVSSKAYLVLTPLPFKQTETPDRLAEMLAMPLDVKTAALLCMGDEVMRETLAAYNEKVNRELQGADPQEDLAPISNLWSLRSALNYEITIAKETPYEMIESPILALTAKGGSPAEAKLLVDTWAEKCIEAARRFQTARQGPSVEAFQVQAKTQLDKLTAVDERLRLYWTENNPELVEQELNTLIGLITNYKDSLAQTQQEIADTTARVAALQTSLQQQLPALPLRWTPPAGLLAALGFTAAAPPANGGPQDALVVEQSNPIYITLTEESSKAQADLVGDESRLLKIQELLTQFDQDRFALQAQLADMKTEKERLSRESEIATEAYKVAASRLEFAQMAKSLNQPELQILALGAEWPMPRFRRAILFGVFLAMMGIICSAAASVFCRVVLGLPVPQES